MTEVALSEVCKIKNGFAFKSTEFKDQGVPLIRISSFEDGPVFFDERTAFVDELYIDSKKDFLVEKGDILIALSGATTGKYGFYTLDRPSLLNQRVAIIKSGRSEKLSSRYFYHYLTILKSRILEKAGGAAQPNISTKQIGEFKIPLPPLSTQKKIAAILDAADAHRQKTKQLLAKYDELAQSIFLEMFGDNDSEKISLSDLIEINPKKSEISSLDKETEVSFVPMADVSEEGDMKINQTRRISEVWSGFTYFREEDVVFAKITPCMENGKGAIARTLVNGIGFGTTEFHVLRPKKGVSTSSWIFQLTHSKFFRKQAESNMTGSAGQKRVPKEFFFKFKIPRPAYESQLKFEEILNNIHHQKFEIKKEVEKADELFNSLLQKAFKGELV
ncbi:restriction endonuclease subunit S [Cyclobacterium salsum]|uniref:restriction endonuclease subunit S n=1 Tax=Cyclobacterium salsum TaxID=2666329 RepID=UPI0013919E64|nr:restriction endonuclease subunit S [Cyclobacterium salsum]